jgi:hypothetical protein
MAKIPPPTKSKKGKGPPPPTTAVVGNLDKAEPTHLMPLNFKVPPEFRREFKTYAAQHDLSLSKLLQESFRVLKEKTTP